MEKENQSTGIILKKVSKHYGEITAVGNINLDLAPGSLTTLLGPSGCGKTTLLRLISGLELPTSGQIFFNDRDVSRLSATERDVGMVFQAYALFPHMNVGANVGYGLMVQKVHEEEKKERVAEALARINLSGYEDRYPDELSGGQQQRVAVARALILKPQVLLFDEPLSNIDSKLRRVMREDIRRLQQETGITSVYVTHDQSEALAVSDEVVVMSNGTIEQQGSPRDLYRRPNSEFVADFMGEANILPATLNMESDTPVVILDEYAISLKSEDAAGIPSGPVKVAVRPEMISLHRQPPATGSSLACKVTWGAYMGPVSEYMVETAVGKIFAIVPATHWQFSIGQEAFLTVDPVGVAVLPS